MMRLSVLSSSSRGNASVITAGDAVVLVDAGISAARIRKGLQECGLSVAQLSGIFLTHEHHDHVCGLGHCRHHEWADGFSESDCAGAAFAGGGENYSRIFGQGWATVGFCLVGRFNIC